MVGILLDEIAITQSQYLVDKAKISHISHTLHSCRLLCHNNHNGKIVAMPIGTNKQSVFPMGRCNMPNVGNLPRQPFFSFVPPLEGLVFGISYASYQPLYLRPSPKYALAPSNTYCVPFLQRFAKIVVVWVFDLLEHSIEWVIWAPREPTTNSFESIIPWRWCFHTSLKLMVIIRFSPPWLLSMFVMNMVVILILISARHMVVRPISILKRYMVVSPIPNLLSCL